MTAEVGTMPAGVPAEVEQDPGTGRRRRKLFLLLGLFLALAVLLGLAIWYLLFRQPIPLPLPLIPETAIPAYSTSIYGAASPSGVAVNAAGDRIFITETGGDRVVRMFDQGGNQLGVLKPPAGTGADHVPVYVAIDPTTSDVYVSDRPTGSIYVYNRDGAYLHEYLPAGAPAEWQPLGLAFDSGGNLYVTDLSAPQRVLKFDPTGRLVLTLGVELGLLFPNGVAVDPDGQIYVTDSNNGRLLTFDASGVLKSKIGRGGGAGNLGLPRGIAIDQVGRVFVVDSSGQGVLVYAALGADNQTPESLGFFGGQGIGDGEFAFPMGIAVDAHGRVYVADTANDRVQVWSY